MTATDELRRLLDERGVEWVEKSQYPLMKCDTAWGDSERFSFAEYVDGGTLLFAVDITPEQAVEATLGGGTCNADETDTWECVRDDLGGYGKTLTVHVMECTECGHTYEHVNGSYEFCPRCGRKVVDA